MQPCTFTGVPDGLVTNQVGIARGLYSEKDFASNMDWVRARFAEHGHMSMQSMIAHITQKKAWVRT
ncbi:hypothetical protein GCM10027285_11660 [Oleiagrimonas citrea]